MRIISPSPSFGTGNSTPLSTRVARSFHQSSKEKETRWGDRNSRGTSLTFRSHLPAVPHQYPQSRQSNKDKENHSRDDRHPRVPRPEDRHVQKRVLEPDRLGMDSSKKRRNGI